VARLGLGSRWLDLAVLAGLLVLLAGAVMGAEAYESGRRAARGEIDVVARVPTSPEGGWSAKEIRVRQGETVRLRLTSEDVTHGFLIPEIGVQSAPIVPGTYQEVTFVAERTGTYRYYCYVFCNHRHGAMVGTLVVEPREEAAAAR
jgi:cytochrome c oxidase subunit II